VYERNGFALVDEKQPLLWKVAGSPVKLLFRERKLAAAG